jgi:hypothetical protein
VVKTAKYLGIIQFIAAPKLPRFYVVNLQIDAVLGTHPTESASETIPLHCSEFRLCTELFIAAATYRKRIKLVDTFSYLANLPVRVFAVLLEPFPNCSDDRVDSVIVLDLLIWSVKIEVKGDSTHTTWYPNVGRFNNRKNFFFGHHM